MIRVSCLKLDFFLTWHYHNVIGFLSFNLISFWDMLCHISDMITNLVVQVQYCGLRCRFLKIVLYWKHSFCVKKKLPPTIKTIKYPEFINNAFSFYDVNTTYCCKCHFVGYNPWFLFAPYFWAFPESGFKLVSTFYFLHYLKFMKRFTEVVIFELENCSLSAILWVTSLFYVKIAMHR